MKLILISIFALIITCTYLLHAADASETSVRRKSLHATKKPKQSETRYKRSHQRNDKKFTPYEAPGENSSIAQKSPISHMLGHFKKNETSLIAIQKFVNIFIENKKHISDIEVDRIKKKVNIINGLAEYFKTPRDKEEADLMKKSHIEPDDIFNITKFIDKQEYKGNLSNERRRLREVIQRANSFNETKKLSCLTDTEKEEFKQNMKLVRAKLLHYYIRTNDVKKAAEVLNKDISQEAKACVLKTLVAVIELDGVRETAKKRDYFVRIKKRSFI